MLKHVVDKMTNMKVLRIIIRYLFYGIKKLFYWKNGFGTYVKDNEVIFCSYNGKNYACSPKKIYEHFRSLDKFNKFHFIWIFEEPEKYSFLLRNPNTTIVKKDSDECYQYLNSAKYWIFNFRAPDHWKPKSKQIYIQCWHGTPFKRLGYDIEQSDNAMNSIWEIREKYRSDAKRFTYLLSSCPFVTDKFSSAWNLKKGNDKILEIGYPRNDELYSCAEEKIKKIKQSLGIKDSINKKIILYAPTWRDNQHDIRQGYVYDTPVDFEVIAEALKEEYIILFRAHYMVANNFNFNKFKGIIYNVSDYDDINDLYIISDLLITDYSSVFFDYAVLKRPIIFFMYDIELYRDEMRGFYLDLSELPGPIVKTEKELIDAIRNIDMNYELSSQLDVFNKKFNIMNDGYATNRLLDILIGE